MTCLSIVPGGELASCLKAAFMPMPVQPLPATLAALGRLCHRAFHASGADGTALATAALDLTSAFLEQSRNAGAGVRPEWLDELRHYMELNFAEPLTLRDLAMRAGVHDVHVIRTFRRHWGTTPARYLLLLRVRAARAALADPARSIADIAAEVGFSSQAHLTDRFRREIGLPPGAWRRQLQAAAG